MSTKKNAPSLESLVDQCCEEYYSKLTHNKTPIEKTFDATVEPTIEEKYYNFERFKEFINKSHCQENLKFLMEIYHYEKIWNKIFKRQSSILKCKDESADRSRKASVATLFSNTSSFKRQPSIVEVTEGETIQKVLNNDKANSPVLAVSNPDTEEGEVASESDKHTLTSKAAKNIISELSIPTVIKSQDDFDSLSFISKESPAITVTDDHRSSRHYSKTANRDVWENLFKTSYYDNKARECSCKDDVENRYSADIDSLEYNESVKQFEVREKLKEELKEKFNYIIQHYVLTNSPFEINLPGEVYSHLISEYEDTHILYHSPLTLLPAKNAVLQLLRENIYYKFLSKQEVLISRERSNSTRSKESNTASTNVEQPQAKQSSGTVVEANDNATILSFTSDESSKNRSTTPILSISNFLNKYHIKVHNGSSSTLSSLDGTTSPTKQLEIPVEKKGSSGHHLHHQHFPKNSALYVKGPCGIEPDMSAYDPKPPPQVIHSGWASKFSKFRLKKKTPPS